MSLRNTAISTASGLTLIFLAGCTHTPLQPDKASPDDAAKRVDATLACRSIDGLTSTVINTTPNLLLCKYSRAANPTSQPIQPYFSLALTVYQGDSDINSIVDAGLWDKLISPLHKTTTSAVATLQIDDGTGAAHPEVPFYTLTRSSDGRSSPASATTLQNGQVLMPYSSASPGQTWTITINYKYSASTDDKTAGAVLRGAKSLLQFYPVVGGVAGTLASQISQSDVASVNDYVSNLFPHPGQPPGLAVSLTAQEYAALDHIEMALYDNGNDGKQRKSVAYATLTPKFLTSLLTDNIDANGHPIYGSSGNAGKTIQKLGNKSILDIYQSQHRDLASGLQSKQAETFQQACREGPADFTNIGFESDTDAVYATWLVLVNSPAADVKNSTCSVASSAAMRKLGLDPVFAPIPGETDTAQRAQNVAAVNAKTDQIAAATARNQDLTSYLAPQVTVTQSVPALQGIAVGSPIYIDAATLSNAISAKGTGILSNYQHTNLTSPTVKAQLSIGGNNYSVMIRWSGIANADTIYSLDIGPYTPT